MRELQQTIFLLSGPQSAFHSISFSKFSRGVRYVINLLLNTSTSSFVSSLIVRRALLLEHQKGAVRRREVKWLDVMRSDVRSIAGAAGGGGLAAPRRALADRVARASALRRASAAYR